MFSLPSPKPFAARPRYRLRPRGGFAWLVWLVICVVLGSCHAVDPPRTDPGPVKGYDPRPCGFDLDDDGRVGEPEDCRICDGRTRDVDGDGVDEDLIYIDCQVGRDHELCGLPDRPCRSVEYAWTSRADGPEDGAEDILCFRGRCSPEVLTPAVGGLEGFRVQPAEGSQARAFRFPMDPTMLVGWDSDGDGEYPPFDPDDVAVLDGGPPEDGSGGQGLSRAFHLGEGNSQLEMAHFSVLDYGRYSSVERSGFVHFGIRGGLRADHLYFHDLELSGINQDQPTQGHRIVFNYFTGGTNFHHLAFVNLKLSNVGGFMVRGSGPYRPGTEAEGGNDGPMRWQNLSVTAHGCDHSSEACREGGGAAFIGWKLWGWIDGIEVLDSIFDANVAEWEPKPMGNGGALLVNATQCSRQWTVRGNEIYDFKVGFEAQGGDGAYCTYDTENDPPRQVPRRTGEVVFDQNIFVNTYQPWRRGDHAVVLKGGDDLNRTLDDVVISNNILASTDGFDACIWVEVGNGRGPNPGPNPGRIDIFANTCYGARAEGRSTGLEISQSRVTTFPAHDIWVRNNIFAGLQPGDYGMRFRYRPEALRLVGNVVSPAARYALGKDRAETLDDLSALLGMPHESRACEPLFVAPEQGDFHLVTQVDSEGESTPGCAIEDGLNLSFWTNVDVDGEPRPEGGPWAAGADQP